ncbi:copper resistance protein CopC [Nonomuraea sp. NPDC050536]|uniref:copper resistance protein CopC n=1 Tax=Nonomuraea sp. NPDC050536 TaxID=3364366 RepID=UPI0037CB91EF
MKTFRNLVAAALGCGLFLALSSTAALAHDTLKSSSPAKNAQVTKIESIELVFSGRIRFPTVVLHDAQGKQVTLDPPEAVGDKVTARVPQPPAPGAYTIAWRVVSSDGHPIEGEIPFTLAGPNGAPVASQPAATPQTAASTGVPVWVWVGLVVLVILGAGTALLTRRSRKSEDLSQQ